MTTGRTLLSGIFGDPVSHSLSPAMHNAAYAALGLDRLYVPFHVSEGNLAAALKAIPALGLLGVNITVPHKERVARMLKNLSAEARALGAVNCVVNRKSGLYGDNTDAKGLEIALRELGCDLKGETALIIGAGGSAPAAIRAAQRLGARRIIVANRTVTRAERLAERISARRVGARGLDALFDRDLMHRVSLVINATSVGVKGERLPQLDYESTRADCLFYDLMYASKLSSFLAPAKALGRKVSDGAGMLLYQGVLAFKLFNRVEADAATMRNALHEALGR